MAYLTSITSNEGWPPVPFRVLIPGYPSFHFTIIELATGGTSRARKWQSVAFDVLEQTIRTSTMDMPGRFVAGEDDMSLASVLESEFEFPIPTHRPAIVAGLQNLKEMIPYLPPAQLRGVFSGGPDLEQIFGYFEASFSDVIPRIPEPWRIWPPSFPIPPRTGMVLRFRSLQPIGDGWDSKHFSDLLQSTIGQLTRLRASGHKAPVGVEAVTPAKDWRLSNQISGRAQRYTLDLQIVLLTFLRQLVMRHGVMGLRFDVVDERDQFITGGQFKFDAYGESEEQGL